MSPTEIAAFHTRTVADMLLAAMFGAVVGGIPAAVTVERFTTPIALTVALLFACVVAFVKAGRLDTLADDERATAKRRGS